MNIHSSKRVICPDYFNRHRKRVYKSDKLCFVNLEDLSKKVTLLCPELNVTNLELVCSSCYKYIEKIDIADKKFNGCHDENFCDSCDVDKDINLQENEDCDVDFRPPTPVLMREMNGEINSLTKNNVSPLRPISKIRELTVENYISKKRKEIIDSVSVVTNAKMQKLYHVPDIELEIESVPDCSCDEWIKNISVALKNTSSTSEKVKLLTLIPESYSKKQLLNSLPEITDYMIKKARKLVETKGIYSEPDIYSGHPLNENIKEKALAYYLNDDLDCSRQSPNARDVVIVKENGEKVKKAKRFLTRSIKEVYQIFKKDNPETNLSIASFYTLRPKHVTIGPINQVCLCIYCANFDLYLAGLQSFSAVSSTELKEIRANILAAITCAPATDSCFLQECKLCPGIQGINFEVLRLSEESAEEEITFAVWNNGELTKKTKSISDFVLEFAGWIFKVNVHIYVKDVQRNAIKLEKENALLNPRHLLIQVDFAENWSVIIKNAVQSNHWLNKQVSIFTAVCQQGDTKKSYAIVSDDCKHDSAHALLATNKVIESMTKLTNIEPEDVTGVSDGAASHFKNRFQLHEMKNYGVNIKRLFSGTGHGKGPVDAIGGLVKHYGTNHNLMRPQSEAIQSAAEFAAKVAQYTTAICLIHLPKEEVESFRENKLLEWRRIKEQPGIQKTHLWKCFKENNEVKLFVARTSQTAMTEIKNTYKKM